ncbi:MAG TPA: LURP-one-related family protein [Thermoclostridium caenicola]|nr:LURP-one-related family protein [Thermoclostridium caenicola]
MLMVLYIRQKVFTLGDKYHVYNENLQPVFTVQGRLFSLGAKIHVYDMTGQELYFISQKLFRFLPEYHIYTGDLLCAIIKKEFTFFRPRLSIQSQYGDYTIEGNLFGMDFAIFLDGQPVGEIHKKWFSFGDSYELIVHDPNNAAFFSTLVIAIDHCLHNEDRR